jgi:CDP-diacylglycerol--serine O-phosphatidyltransferase
MVMADVLEQGAVVQKRKGVRAGIYLLPNMITATSLFCGFLAIKFSIDGRLAASPEVAMQAFLMSSYLLLIAGVADGLDGSVARWTRTTSAFGVQFDSLSDLVSFGVAPAIIVYNFALHELGRIGLGAAFIFAACGALRLARFNVQSSLGKASGNFTGIPIPMGAAPLAVYLLAFQSLREWLSDSSSFEWQKRVAEIIMRPHVNAWILFGIIILLAFGMISTFEYISTKSLKLPRKHPFRVFAIVLVSLILLLSLNFTITLTIFMLIYSIHGPILWLFFKRDRAAEEEELFSPSEEDEEEEGRPS